MKKTLLAALMGTAVACAALSALPAAAQESPTGTWGSSVTWRDANSRAVDLATGEGQLQARSGGFRPATSSYNQYGTDTTTYNQAYNGPVQSSSSTNAVNLTTSSSSVSQTNSPGATSGITYTTGATSYNANQSAAAKTGSTSGDGSQALGQ